MNRVHWTISDMISMQVIDASILPMMVTCIDKFGDVDASNFHSNDRVSKLFHNDHEADSPRTLVLKLVINCLQQKTPNLGQYLTGFSCESVFAVKRTSLQVHSFTTATYLSMTCLSIHITGSRRRRLPQDVSPFDSESDPETRGGHGVESVLQ